VLTSDDGNEEVMAAMQSETEADKITKLIIELEDWAREVRKIPGRLEADAPPGKVLMPVVDLLYNNLAQVLDRGAEALRRDVGDEHQHAATRFRVVNNHVMPFDGSGCLLCEATFEWGVRGIGADRSPGCFVCGVQQPLYSNFAAFVRTKAIGEQIVGMFLYGAWLDYREFEPTWIQVKVGACDDHVPHLQLLSEETKAISQRRIAEITAWKPIKEGEHGPRSDAGGTAETGGVRTSTKVLREAKDEARAGAGGSASEGPRSTD